LPRAGVQDGAIMDTIAFALNPDLDARAVAQCFARDGRVRIERFLRTESAEALYHMLRGRSDWTAVINSDSKTIELSRETRAAMTAEQHAALDQAVYAGARSGFQYRYETLRVPDDDMARAACSDPLAAFARWLSDGEARDFLRTVTGIGAIDFADMQGTAYAPGDFLTGHDDFIPDKRRHAAYVLGLTPVWRTEWGGLLLFHQPDGALRGYMPQFNTLTLFSVPHMHSVSEVTRAAAYRRYSVTGWLRSR